MEQVKVEIEEAVVEHPEFSTFQKEQLRKGLVYLLNDYRDTKMKVVQQDLPRRFFKYIEMISEGKRVV